MGKCDRAHYNENRMKGSYKLYTFLLFLYTVDSL